METMPFDHLTQLIERNKWGYYQLMDAQTGHTVDIFPLSVDDEDENKNKSKAGDSKDLIKQLNHTVEMVGSGRYKINLQTNSKAPHNRCTYWFHFGKTASEAIPNTPMQGMGGLGSLGEVQAHVEKSVSDAVERLKEMQQKDFEIFKLQQQIAELKKPKPSKKAENSAMQFAPAALAGIILIGEKVSPGFSEKIGQIMEGLPSFSDDEDLDENKGTEFKRED